MGRQENLYRSLRQMNEAIIDISTNPNAKIYKDSLNKTIDKLKDISDAINKSIGYLNRMKRDITGKESINDIDDKQVQIVQNLSKYTKIDFDSIIEDKIEE